MRIVWLFRFEIDICDGLGSINVITFISLAPMCATDG